MTDGTALVRALLAADRDAVARSLADRAAFNSPVRRYEDRAVVVHLLTLIGGILPGVRVERGWTGSEGAVTHICAQFDEGRLDGVIEELYGPDRRVREVTLLLRPLDVMMPAIRRMAAALERDPAPTPAGE